MIKNDQQLHHTKEWLHEVMLVALALQVFPLY
ncbi:hypothetical protein NUACC26_051960 [Scytonema sp. NUACC26]